MGNAQSISKINYEDVQHVIKNMDGYLLINTMNENEQSCLLPNTVNIHKEADLINKLLKTGNKQIKIIIYGKNCNDSNTFTKYSQLNSLGFYHIYIYMGGLFEWLMLQDIYGTIDFPTTKRELDILKYKSNKLLDIHLLEN